MKKIFSLILALALALSLLPQAYAEDALVIEYSADGVSFTPISLVDGIYEYDVTLPNDTYYAYMRITVPTGESTVNRVRYSYKVNSPTDYFTDGNPALIGSTGSIATTSFRQLQVPVNAVKTDSYDDTTVYKIPIKNECSWGNFTYDAEDYSINFHARQPRLTSFTDNMGQSNGVVFIGGAALNNDNGTVLQTNITGSSVAKKSDPKLKVLGHITEPLLGTSLFIFPTISSANSTSSNMFQFTADHAGTVYMMVDDPLSGTNYDSWTCLNNGTDPSDLSSWRTSNTRTIKPRTYNDFDVDYWALAYQWKYGGATNDPDNEYNAYRTTSPGVSGNTGSDYLTNTYKLYRTFSKEFEADETVVIPGWGNTSGDSVILIKWEEAALDKVSKPSANPASGAVEIGTAVTLATATEGATIYYTTNGGEPKDTSPVYTSPITVNSGMTIKAVAVKDGMDDSDVATFTYTIKPVETPTASVAGGTVEQGTGVVLATETEGAAIYYTTDGSTPTTASTVYSSPIIINENKTIKAIAVKDGMPNSDIATFSYVAASRLTVLNEDFELTPEDSENYAEKGGWYGISDNQGGQDEGYNDTKGFAPVSRSTGGRTWRDETRYTKYYLPYGVTTGKYVFSFMYNKGERSAESSVYVSDEDGDGSGEQVFNASAFTAGIWYAVEITVDLDSDTFTATKDGEIYDSGTYLEDEITNIAFRFKCSNNLASSANNSAYITRIDDMKIDYIGNGVFCPVATPVSGAVEPGTAVVLSTKTEGAAIYYTTDGSTPTTASTLYTGAITVNENTTIKAIAVKSGMETSIVKAFTYTIKPVETPTVSPARMNIEAGTLVTLSTETEGAAIYYTTDGSTPTTASSLYTEAITVNENTTIKAIAVKAGKPNSDVVTASYVVANHITVLEENFETEPSDSANYSSEGGWYGISDNQGGQDEGYNDTNGFAPVSRSTGGRTWRDEERYTRYYLPYGVTTGAYVFSFMYNKGNKSKESSVYVSAADSDGSGVKVFDTDLSTFRTGKWYSMEITVDLDSDTFSVTKDGEIYNSGTYSDSEITNIAFKFVCANNIGGSDNFATNITRIDNFKIEYIGNGVLCPVATPVSGMVEQGTAVVLSTKTEGAAIYYTTDGSTPTTASTLYTGAITVNENTTIKAIAVKSGMETSSVAVFNYETPIEVNKILVNGKKITDYAHLKNEYQIEVDEPYPYVEVEYGNASQSSSYNKGMLPKQVTLNLMEGAKTRSISIDVSTTNQQLYALNNNLKLWLSTDADGYICSDDTKLIDLSGNGNSFELNGTNGVIISESGMRISKETDILPAAKWAEYRTSTSAPFAVKFTVNGIKPASYPDEVPIIASKDGKLEIYAKRVENEDSDGTNYTYPMCVRYNGTETEIEIDQEDVLSKVNIIEFDGTKVTWRVDGDLKATEYLTSFDNLVLLRGVNTVSSVVVFNDIMVYDTVLASVGADNPDPYKTVWYNNVDGGIAVCGAVAANVTDKKAELETQLSSNLHYFTDDMTYTASAVAAKVKEIVTDSDIAAVAEDYNSYKTVKSYVEQAILLLKSADTSQTLTKDGFITLVKALGNNDLTEIAENLSDTGISEAITAVSGAVSFEAEVKKVLPLQAVKNPNTVNYAKIAAVIVKFKGTDYLNLNTTEFEKFDQSGRNQIAAAVYSSAPASSSAIQAVLNAHPYTVTPDYVNPIGTVGGGGGGGGGGALSVLPSAPIITGEEPVVIAGFSDMKGAEWAGNALSYMVEKGFVSGISSTEFAPQKTITRGEFVAIITRCEAFAIEDTDEDIFDDVSKDYWGYKNIIAAYKNGIISGVGEREFNPNGEITRQDIAVVLYNVYKLQAETEEEDRSFADWDSVSDYAKEAISKLHALKILNGDGTNYSPLGLCTRAEAVQAIYGYLMAMGK